MLVLLPPPNCLLPLLYLVGLYLTGFGGVAVMNPTAGYISNVYTPQDIGSFLRVLEI